MTTRPTTYSGHTLLQSGTLEQAETTETVPFTPELQAPREVPPLPVLTDGNLNAVSNSGDQVPLQNNEPSPSVIPEVGSGTTDPSGEQQLTLPELQGQDSSEAQQLIEPQEPQSDGIYLPPSDESGENASLAVWWEKDITAPVLRNRPVMAMSLPEALNRALNEAPELKILHADWYISLQEELRRDAGFDWTTFANTVWDRDSMPVGSTLDGAFRRLRTRTGIAAAGIRRLDRYGGEISVSQQLGLKNSNSQFISPNDQGSSQLALNYELPLLRGAGELYNTGGVRLAQLDKDIAFDRMQAGIQDHLLETARAYWALVLTRGDFLQKITSWSRASAIADEMKSRINVDVTPGALDRALAEVSSRLTQCIQAEHDVVSAQETLLELIYAARYTEFTAFEVVTTSIPPHQSPPVDPDVQAEQAVHLRSEVHQAIREIRAASIEYDLAQSEMLPLLNMSLSGYSAGLRPQYNVGQSFADQFTTGEPGLGLGFECELPYKNRAARATSEQKRISMVRLQREFENVVGAVRQDVRQQAIRRNKFGAMLPQQREYLIISQRLLDYSQTRRDFLADGVRVAELYLNDLLQIQNRLQSAEYLYLQNQVSYALADNALMRGVASLTALADSAAVYPSDSPIAPDASSADASSTAADFQPVPQMSGHTFGTSESTPSP
ncbi:MAG: TolC family protein [Planctomyces sp.]